MEAQEVFEQVYPAASKNMMTPRRLELKWLWHGEGRVCVEIANGKNLDGGDLFSATFVAVDKHTGKPFAASSWNLCSRSLDHVEDQVARVDVWINSGGIYQTIKI